MAAVTTVGVNGSAYRRSGAAQADSGQTDWMAVPSWAKYARVALVPTAMAGTTPIWTLSLWGLTMAGDDETYASKLAEHAALTGITAVGVNEVQTLTLTAGIATETFKLTNGTESAAVTLPTGGYANVTAAQIKTALLTIGKWSSKTADIAVVKSTNDYAITFSGSLGRTDIGDTTVTSKTGAADGSVAETTKGVPGSVLIADIGPSMTGIANDVTNSATADSYVSLNALLPPLLGVRLDLDRTTGNETYTYTLTVTFFK
jgi:hypothetical protein